MIAALRTATAADSAGIAACVVACWREAYRGLLSDSFLDHLDQGERQLVWSAILTRAGSEQIMVATVDDLVVGFAAAGPSHDQPPVRDWQLFAIYLREANHRKGIGQRLFDATVGVQPASLWVAQGNTRAIAFYQRNGFRPDGTHIVAAELDDLVEIRMVR